MADQRNVAAILVRLAVDRVAKIQALERFAAVQLEWTSFRYRNGALGQMNLRQVMKFRCHRYFPVLCPVVSGTVCLVPFAASIACARSAMMSRTSSMPTESRTSSAVTPVSRCSGSLSCWWVVEEG